MKTTIIGIAGGTGSGKSTFSNRLKNFFGDQISIIYHDNYYKKQDHLPFEERKLNNYDHADALDTDLLIEHLKLLKNGIPVQGPMYDFSQHIRSQQTIELLPCKVIIVERILVLQNSELRKQFDTSIFVDADADERILRRAARDIKERGRDFQDIIQQYSTTVKPMHHFFVEPTKAYADIVIGNAYNNVAFNVIKNEIQHIINSE